MNKKRLFFFFAYDFFFFAYDSSLVSFAVILNITHEFYMLYSSCFSYYLRIPL